MSACLASERQGGHCIKGRNLCNDQNTEATSTHLLVWRKIALSREQAQASSFLQQAAEVGAPRLSYAVLGVYLWRTRGVVRILVGHLRQLCHDKQDDSR